MNERVHSLRALARSFGVELDFRDVWGGHRHVGTETVLAVLRSLGAAVEDPSDAPEALRVRRRQLWGRPMPPVVVAWQGEPSPIPLRLPAVETAAQVGWRIRLEDGGERTGTWSLDDVRRPRFEGVEYRVGRVPLPEDLPCGYHRLCLEFGDGRGAEALLLAAPTRIETPASPSGGGQGWGVFLPLYALRSETGGCGIADVDHLRRLVDWCGARGGSTVGLLPVLATAPGEASPYAPLSRCMWGMRYVDLEAAARELRRAGADAGIRAGERAIAARLAAADRVDPEAVDFLKGSVVRRLASAAFELPADAGPRAELEAELATDPELRAWARFRAARDRHGHDWRGWPDGAAAEVSGAGTDAGLRDDPSWRTHAYGQWLARRQWRQAAGHAADREVDLYLDLPLGVGPDGFDVWRRPPAFARGCTVGAPPDTFFVAGQDWGFAPVHPEADREAALHDWIAAVRHHLGVARILRVDHVMGLHRLWWVPDGSSADAGAYVRYHAPERFAVLAIEARRARASVIGEDLGTVPAVVRQRMERRGVRRMWILQAEVGVGDPPGVPDPPAESLVGAGTHDMPPFAAWWRGDDLEWLQRLGRLDARAAEEEGRRRERQRRALRDGAPERRLDLHVAGDRDVDDLLAEAARLLGPWLARLAAGPEELMVINLEDIWLETQPQNVPGHTDPAGDLPCWRHRARRSLEEIAADPRIDRLLAAVDTARRERP